MKILNDLTMIHGEDIIKTSMIYQKYFSEIPEILRGETLRVWRCFWSAASPSVVLRRHGTLKQKKRKEAAGSDNERRRGIAGHFKEYD